MIPFRRLSFLAVLLSTSLLQIRAQIVSGNGFIKGSYVETAVAPCGSYGSTVAAPAAYHPNSASGRLGFRVDYGRDGWGVGTPPAYGDYLMTTTPAEGWALSFDGINFLNTHNSTLCASATFPGSVTAYRAGTPYDTVIWAGSTAGMSVRQYTIVPDDSLFIYTKVVLKNTGATPHTGIFYSRLLEPDNDFYLTGKDTTTNLIMRQPGSLGLSHSLVRATGLSGTSPIFLGSDDSRCTVGYYGTITSFASARVSFCSVSPGYSSTANYPILNLFRESTLAPGDSVIFSFVYVFASAEVDHALTYIESDCHDTELNVAVSTCTPYTLGSSSLSTTGYYHDTITTACGADSIVHLLLTVGGFSANFTVKGDTLKASTLGLSSYQWLDCWTGLPIPGATGPYHVFTSSGSYQLITSSGLCNDTSDCTIAFLPGSDHYLQGNYVEVGISDNGSYGGRFAPPAGYHPNTYYPGVGYVADVGMDGWSAGSIGYCGDYFLPGSPEEGWSITFNGNSYLNRGQGAAYSIPGSNTALLLGAAEDTAVWEGAVGGMAIRQMTMVPNDSVYFLTRVQLKNTTASTLTDVYYVRNVDPDNEQSWTGNFTTVNTIESQPTPTNTRALVSATGLTYLCYLGIGTYDTLAQVGYGGFTTEEAINMYTDPMYTHAVGSSMTSDIAIQMAFHVGDLAPGDSITLSFVHVMDSSQVPGALLRTGSPCVAAVVVNDTVAACSYTFGSTPLTASGDYSQTFTTPEGCDSTVHLHFTLLTPPHTFPTVTACDSYLFDGALLTSSGIYNATFSTPGDCDSLVTLDLTITNHDTSVVDLGGVLHANASGLTYQWQVCGAWGLIPIAGATLQDFDPSTSGNYAVVVSDGFCSDTSACHYVLVTGQDATTTISIELFPNPVTDLLEIRVSPASMEMDVQIIDLTGTVVWQQCCTGSSRFSADLSGLSQGIYFVSVRTPEMQRVMKIVKAEGR
jgi:hypothetical protein